MAAPPISERQPEAESALLTRRQFLKTARLILAALVVGCTKSPPRSSELPCDRDHTYEGNHSDQETGRRTGTVRLNVNLPDGSSQVISTSALIKFVNHITPVYCFDVYQQKPPDRVEPQITVDWTQAEQGLAGLTIETNNSINSRLGIPRGSDSSPTWLKPDKPLPDSTRDSALGPHQIEPGRYHDSDSTRSILAETLCLQISLIMNTETTLRIGDSLIRFQQQELTAADGTTSTMMTVDELGPDGKTIIGRLTVYYPGPLSKVIGGKLGNNKAEVNLSQHQRLDETATLEDYTPFATYVFAETSALSQLLTSMVTASARMRTTQGQITLESAVGNMPASEALSFLNGVTVNPGQASNLSSGGAYEQGVIWIASTETTSPESNGQPSELPSN